MKEHGMMASRHSYFVWETFGADVAFFCIYEYMYNYILFIHNIIYAYWVSLCLCQQKFIEAVLNRHRPLRINILTTEARDLANHCLYLKNSKLFHEATWVKIVAGLLSTKKHGKILVISVGSSQSWSSSMPVLGTLSSGSAFAQVAKVCWFHTPRWGLSEN